MSQPDFLPIHDLHCRCTVCRGPRPQPSHFTGPQRAPHGSGFAIAIGTSLSIAGAAAILFFIFKQL